MAMIRGRKVKVNDPKSDLEKNIVDPGKPLARLKEQRRLTIGYSSTPEPVLTAINDPDPYYKDKKTFLVLNKDRLIYRFSDRKSLCFFSRKSRIRMAFIEVLVNKWFNCIVITTILLNCLVMMINGNEKPPWSEKYVENVFTAVYTVEMVVKIVGRGFALHPFSYLRDPWNWIDFVVIISAYVLIILASVFTAGSANLSSLTFLRAIRVLRVFKTVSVIPGLRTIVSALAASTKALKDAMLLSLLGFCMFSLMGVQLFGGTLRNKCVLLPPWMLPPTNCSDSRSSFDGTCSFLESYGGTIDKHFGRPVLEEMLFLNNGLLWEGSAAEIHDMYLTTHENGTTVSHYHYTEQCVEYENVSATNWTFQQIPYVPFNSTGYEFNWTRWINQKEHYLRNGKIFMLCGNRSGALNCPSYSECIRVGENPNYDFTNFDSFHFAFLSVFRLSLQDNWEELYLQIIEANGQFAVFFFLVIIFLGSYYLVNLILAVVASAYETQRKDVENALEEEKRELLGEKAILTKRRNAARTVSDIARQSLSVKKTSWLQKCLCCYTFKNIFLLWSCCVGSSFLCRIRNKLKDFFSNSAAEMITVLLVVLNTLFMCLEQYPTDVAFEAVLATSNKVFTVLFTIEMVLKIFALAPYEYFTVSWNIFDFVVVSLSLVELVLPGDLVDGVSVLRTFRLIRLVRILKLARSWPTLSKLMQMIADSLSKVGYLTLVLLIVLIIFALAGMQTVGTQFYMNEQGIPLRWHMNDFPHAFLVVFRIQCGEWIQSMWSCMHSVREEESGGLVPVCLFIFVGVVLVGNLVVLNLFLALLLNSFSGEALNGGSGKGKGAKKFLTSLRQAGRKALPKLPSFKKNNKIVPERGTSSSPQLYNHQLNDHFAANASSNEKRSEPDRRNGTAKVTIEIGDRGARSSLDIVTEISGSKTCPDLQYLNANACLSTTDTAQLAENHLNGDNIRCNNSAAHQTSATVVTTKGPPQSKLRSTTSTLKQVRRAIRRTVISKFCFVDRESTSQCWSAFRDKMNFIVQHNYFESFIMFFILLSSVALVFDDVNLPKRPTMKAILRNLDRVFTAIFFTEMIMKWIGFGLRKYFKNGWCLLDFFIVLVSLVSLSLELVAAQTNLNAADLSFLRVLRSLRAFRPLRAMSRFQGIKVVTDALFRSIPSILNVFVICLVFWLIFAIMGVNFFAGKMSACRWRETGEKVWHPRDFENWPNLKKHYRIPPINVTNRATCDCLANLTDGQVYWKNLEVNFDNVLIAYVSLLQIATFKGWMPIMYAAVDSPQEIDEQPIRDNNVAYYFFFVAFIIFGAFFTLNLFISVVIDNFNQQKKKFEFDGAELFLTETQMRLHNAIKKLKAKLPKRLVPIPKSRWRSSLYLLVTGDKFELAVMAITILNLFSMAFEYEGMAQEEGGAFDTLQIISYIFLGIFTIEILLRIAAMGLMYFRVPWNIFDFLVIFGSLLANVIYLSIPAAANTTTDVPTVPTSPWLPMLRMIRIVRILRVARVASGIRTLLFALMLSAPALFNVGSLLLLFMFIYAIFGMSQFSHVEKKGALNDVLNFETFPNTFLLLFQMSTSAGWDGFMEPTLYVDGPNPECNPGLNDEKRTCMSTTFIGYFYFISYLLVTFVIVTNMYIAIILENFDLATKDNEEKLTADDFEHFFDMWQRFDQNGNGKLTVDQLCNLLHRVDKPLCIRKPNKEQIANMKIPMYGKYELHMVDVVAALMKRILGSDGYTEEMETELKEYYNSKTTSKLNTSEEQPITDTYRYIQREVSEKQLNKSTSFRVVPRVILAAKLLRGTLSLSSPIPTNGDSSKDAAHDEISHCKVAKVDVHHRNEAEFSNECLSNETRASTGLQRSSTGEQAELQQTSVATKNSTDYHVSTSETMYFQRNTAFCENGQLRSSEGLSAVADESPEYQLAEIHRRNATRTTAVLDENSPTSKLEDVHHGSDKIMTVALRKSIGTKQIVCERDVTIRESSLSCEIDSSRTSIKKNLPGAEKADSLLHSAEQMV